MSYGLFALKAPAYQRDVTFLKRYGTSKFRLIQMASVRTKGVELPKKSPKYSVNDQKLDNNICRARSKIRDYGFCNDWSLFVTLTLDPSKMDVFDLSALNRTLSQWFRDYRKKYGVNVKYLLIPEKHKSGAIHLHGFLLGLPVSHLRLFHSSEHLPYYILNQLSQGKLLYTWPAYEQKFGYVVVEPIRNKDRAVSYITKYVTKDLALAVSDLGAHLYYSSQGLAKATELKRGRLTKEFIPDFQNDFCRGKWYSQRDTSEQRLREYIL